jgi:hypothetical protein
VVIRAVHARAALGKPPDMEKEGELSEEAIEVAEEQPAAHDHARWTTKGCWSICVHGTIWTLPIT